ncbi:MAG TPA: threonine/serine exporter family protein, partial [Thermoanaerobaculia bacterium]|nr:threonine/serine exporter family protein [Thermoanaerobaculia bacterium]
SGEVYGLHRAAALCYRPSRPRLRARSAVAPDPTAVRFLTRLGRALHEAGDSAPELEAALLEVARRFDVRAQFFSTPTSLLSAFGEGEAQRTHLERVEPAAIDLGRLAALHRLIGRLLSGELALGQAEHELERASGRSPGHPAWLAHLSWGLSSAASAVFLGGGWAEVGVAALIGLLTGLVARGLERRRDSGLIFAPLAAALASLVATVAAAWLGELSVYIATLAGIIYLIPGFTLTVALTELATRHLSSGTARFASALVVFLTITFGVAIGSRLGVALVGEVAPIGPVPIALWGELVALLVAPLALSVLFRAPWSEAPWIVAAGILGFQAGRLGTVLISPELGMFVGALAIGLTARLYRRLSGRPESLLLVPAILLLVPGSIGYRSFSSLLEHDVVLGVETAFRMILVAVSLVAGLLVANVLLPLRPARR